MDSDGWFTMTVQFTKAALRKALQNVNKHFLLKTKTFSSEAASKIIRLMVMVNYQHLNYFTRDIGSMIFLKAKPDKYIVQFPFIKGSFVMVWKKEMEFTIGINMSIILESLAGTLLKASVILRLNSTIIKGSLRMEGSKVSGLILTLLINLFTKALL